MIASVVTQTATTPLSSPFSLFILYHFYREAPHPGAIYLSEAQAQLHFYICLRTTVYLLQPRRYVVAVHIVGGARPDSRLDMARQVGTYAHCVMQSLAVVLSLIHI